MFRRRGCGTDITALFTDITALFTNRNYRMRTLNKQYGQCTYNVTLRCLNAITVAVEKHILSLCL